MKVTRIWRYLSLVTVLWLMSVSVMGTASFAETRDEVLMLIEEHYYGTVDTESLKDMELPEIISQLDDYSGYFDVGMVKGYEETTAKSYRGIGLQIMERSDQIIVRQVLEGTPAEKAGFMSGDIITGIGNKTCKGMSVATVSGWIRACVGPELDMTVVRDSEEYQMTVSIGWVEPEGPVRAKMLSEDIAYVKISRFSSDVARQFDNAADILERGGIEKVVLDLRGNTGGLLSEAIAVCKRVVAQGPVVRIEDEKGYRHIYESYRESSPFEILVLTDGQTASASEIVMAAIVESGAGISLGKPTYGKGYVQKVFKLSNDDYFRLTTAQYFTRDGNPVQDIGLEPTVELSEDQLNSLLNNTLDLNRMFQVGCVVYGNDLT